MAQLLPAQKLGLIKRLRYLYMVYPIYPVDPDHVVYYEYDEGDSFQIWWTDGLNPNIDIQDFPINTTNIWGSTEFWFMPLEYLP